MGWWASLLGVEAAQDRYLDDWVKGIERGLLSATGLRVTIEDALTVPGISACIQVLADDISKVPLELKRRTDDGFAPAAEHPLHDLLKFGPSPWLSSYAWRRQLAHTVLAHGNGYSRIWRTEMGRLDRIAPLQPGSTTVRWAADGEPFFDLVGAGGAVERGLTWQDILHVAYRGSSDRASNGGVLGVSPILQNKETVALALATERFAARFFANGARPSAVIEMDRRLPNDEVANRLRAAIERTYSGVDNAFKVAILELGMKIKEFSANPKDSQLIETRKEQAVQACTMYGVPPHKIGVLDRATNNNIEHQGIDYVTGPISSLARNIESAIAVSCLTPEERLVYKVEHNLEGLMRGDILSRYRAYAIGRQWGWLSADDVRETENRNKLPDGQGQVYLSPLNMVPAGEDPAKDDEPPKEESRRGALRRIAAAAAGKLNGAGAHPPAPRHSSLVGPDGEPITLN